MLKRHDRKLFCVRKEGGVRVVMRESYVSIPHWLDDETVVYHMAKSPHEIFYLTDSWSVRGNPRDWGLEVIYQRIRETDGWGVEDPYNRLIRSYDKADASKARDTANLAESMAKELRPVFKKAFNDYNVSTMAKVDRRRKKEKSIKI